MTFDIGPIYGGKMENQKREQLYRFGCLLLLVFAPIYLLTYLITKSLMRGIKWTLLFCLFTYAAWGLGFLLKKVLEKFRVTKFQFEGELVVLPRDLKERSEIVMASYGLIFIGLLVAGAYFDVREAYIAVTILVAGGATCVLTVVVLLTWLISDIDDLKSGDDKNDNKMSYIFIVLFTHTILLAIAFLLFLLYLRAHSSGSE